MQKGLFSFKQVSESPVIHAHQGIATDGNYFYVFHNNAILKYTKDWELVGADYNVNQECGVSHLGDGDYYNGYLYVVADNFHSCNSYLPSKICVWKAASLEFLGCHDVSRYKHEVSSLTVVPDEDAFYVTSFCDSRHIFKYSMRDFHYIGRINLSNAVKFIQGITHDGHFLYLVSGYDNLVWKVKKDGTVVGRVQEGLNEGLDYDDIHRIFYILNDPGGCNSKIYGFKNLNREDPFKQFTVAFWIYLNSLPGELDRDFAGVIYSSLRPYNFYLSKVQRALVMDVTTYDAEAHVKIPERMLSRRHWYFITGTYDGEYVRLYLNGTLVASLPLHGFPRFPHSLMLGSEMLNRNPWYFYDGRLDEVKIYNRALSQHDIEILYHNDLEKLNYWYFSVDIRGLRNGVHSYHMWEGSITGDSDTTETRCLRVMGVPTRTN